MHTDSEALVSLMLHGVLPFFSERPFNNHVIMPLLNYQATSIRLKPPIGGGLGLLHIDAR